MCAFCSRFKRGLLYSCCRIYKYNKLVLAQHLDDLAESFMMSALHNGQIRTMKANYKIEAGDVSVIRPLVYIRETATRDFSQQSKLPIINENCPACFEQPKERDRVKKLLKQEESMVPGLFYNLRKAFLPLLHDDTYVAMTNVVQQIEARNKGCKYNSQVTRNNNSKTEVFIENEKLLNDSLLAAASTITTSSNSIGQKRPFNGSTQQEAQAIEGEFETEEMNGNNNTSLTSSNNNMDQQLVCSRESKYCAPCYELM